MRPIAALILAVALIALGCASSPEGSAPAASTQAAAPAPPVKKVNPRELGANVAFEAGSSELSDASEQELASLAGQLSSFPNPVHVVGHQPAGAGKAERWLPEQRAKAVASYLVSQGIDFDRVTLQQLDAPAQESATVGDAAPPNTSDVVVSVR